MKKANHKSTTVLTFVIIISLPFGKGWGWDAKAQLDSARLMSGYTSDASSCTTLVTTARPAVTDALGIITATDNMDVRAWSGSCNQQSEVFITIDKAHPNFLIAGANTLFATPTANGGDLGYYYSVDSGLHWTGTDQYPSFPPPAFLVGGNAVSGDPTMAFDMNGNAFMTTLAANYQGFYITSSNENNIIQPWNTAYNPPLPTWSSDKFTQGTTSSSYSYDKDMIAIDNIANLNNIYIAGTQFITNSCAGSSGSITFSLNTTSSAATNNATNAAFTGSSTADLRWGATGFGQGANVQTGPNGEVYVCWADYLNGTFPATNIGFAYSSDGGVTFPQVVAGVSAGATNAIFTTTGANPQYTGGVDVACDAGDPNYGGASPVGGTSGVHVTDFPAMAVDKSCGPYSGRIYIAYPEQDPGGSGEGVIALCYSCDNGLTWSQPTNTPVISNSINTATSPFGTSFGSSFMPWITVDDVTGIVSVVYYQFDNIVEGSPNFITDTYVAFSSDGGNTFTNILVSDISHVNQSIEGYYATEGYIGNYIGITSYNGKAYAAWMDDRIFLGASNTPSNLWQVYISEIDYTSSGALPNYSTASPTTLNIPPTTISSSGSVLYQAVQEINVPTTPTFQTNSGTNVEIRAGKEVHHANGFSASNELWSHIQYVPGCATCGTSDGRLSASTGRGNPSTVVATPTMIDTKLGTNTKLGIFPNPTSGVVYLDLSAQNAGNLLVNLRDVNGNQVIQTIYNVNAGANSYKLDMSTLNSGVYFINITDENGVTIKNDKLVLMGQ